MESMKLRVSDVLDLRNKEKCLYIPDIFVVDVVKFMRAKKYLLKPKTQINRLRCGFEFASNNRDNLIRVPLVMYDHTDDLNVLGGIFDILNDDYGFNIIEYARDNNINVKVAVTIFCILHELAHNRYNAYFEEKGKGENYVMDRFLKDYLRVYNIKDRRQVDIEYRKIPTEMYADKQAIKMMKKHRVAFRNICKRHKDKFEYIDMTDYDNKEKYDYRFKNYYVRY